MDLSNYRQYQAEQDLLRCGLSHDSINAIRATNVVTRDGAQHVVPTTDVPRLAGTDSSITATADDTSFAALSLQLEEQKRMFARYKRFSEERLSTVEKQLSTTLNILKDLSAQVETQRSNAVARAKSSQVHATVSPAPAQTQQEPQVPANGSVEIKSAPTDRPIDRNNVSPESVQIEKIFYCGNK